MYIAPKTGYMRLIQSINQPNKIAPTDLINASNVWKTNCIMPHTNVANVAIKFNRVSLNDSQHCFHGFFVIS